ncbi:MULTISPECIES: hypothetical protein [unclassified Halomonas]|uniref:hypothetical protein n=1 Tax=unclassified Halomonas TaxID=2609666 RepID=UPI002076742C|nr:MULTISPECIES: hypothetical protein [unclassified Halomonas]
MIDAEKYHRPEQAAELINKALEVCKTKPELARRLGMTRQYINAILRADKTMSYGMQIMLEQLASESPAADRASSDT